MYIININNYYTIFLFVCNIMVLKLSQAMLVIGIVAITVFIMILVRGGSWSVLTPILFGLITSAVFGSIDALFFLTAEQELNAFLKNKGIPLNLIPLIVGALSASISIFIASYIEHYMGKKFIIIKHPLLDAIGIIIGTLLISIGYIAYLGYNKSHHIAIPQSAEKIVKADPILLS